jgi:hypothetical protein
MLNILPLVKPSDFISAGEGFVLLFFFFLLLFVFTMLPKRAIGVVGRNPVWMSRHTMKSDGSISQPFS